ncbi:dienelactone hydrolase family protein [Acinetobacter qingfengensis]|uniref:Dienelactone hydrolase n=1 Tax=Acinetobacter qingfengensis TaxID=1262585 RepID=A0A1E7R4X9_9GAMM|nr:dienelactone hydrolase family protein [Acinetobacter qingfengensis]KAA8732383.1 dienelactone hydrolase family protein [Acinetobacter qingfengensis]OEY94378.1 dienelactone hydrolase [Acinetobacter qingfengensis]
MTQLIQTKEIQYKDSTGQTLIGYLAYPENTSQAPGILVCPEWWGRNDYIERRARELAEQGYVALAIDMYGDKKLAVDADTAGKYMMSTFENPATIVDRATAAYQTLVAQNNVNADKVAAIGFCYGGKVALDLARSGANLKVVATFHANLSAQQPAQAGKFTAEVLVAHGADDSMVSLNDVENFKQEMTAAQVKYSVDIYPNTKHGFTNPVADEKAAKYGTDLAYNPESEKQAIAKLYDLLKRTFA